MRKTAIYVRVSTQDQAEEGYSIEEQTDKLMKYCDIKDWHVHDVYVDPGFTGSNIDRPAMKRLIQDAANGRINTVLVYKLDRLSRSQKDTLYLIEDVFAKHGVDFVSLNENFDTSSAFGKAMIGILSVFAQLEREQITERMQMGKLGRAKSGKAMSWVRPPFGYKYEDGAYIVDELQAEVIRYVYKKYLAGISVTRLRDMLNEAGHIGKDIPWSHRTLGTLLRNPVYTGDVPFKGKLYDGLHDAIIPKEMFETTQKEIALRQKSSEKYNPRPFQSKYLLSGIVRCGYCQAPLTSVLGPIRKDGTRSHKYQCTNKIIKRRVTVYNDNAKCDSPIYQMPDIENHVLDTIEKMQMDPQSLKHIGTEEKKTDIRVYKERLKTIDKQMAKLSNLYLSDLLSLEEMQQRAQELQAEKAGLQNKVTDTIESEAYQSKKEVISMLRKSKLSIKKDTLENQKILVRKMIKKIDVKDGEILIRWAFEH